MRFFILLIALAFVATGCSDESAKKRKKIEELEKEVELAPVDATLRSLVAHYIEYMDAYPEDDFSAVYTHRTAEIYYRSRNYREAITHLENGLQKYPESEIYPQMLLFAGMIYEDQIKDTNRAGVLYQAYIDEFPEGEGIEQAKFFFKPEDEKMRLRIDELAEAVNDPTQPNGINKVVAETLMHAYARYVKRFDGDAYCAVYCEKGGYTANTIGQTLAAIEFWTKLHKSYENYHLYPEMVFALGSCYENQMPGFMRLPETKHKGVRLLSDAEVQGIMDANHLERAKDLYQEVIDKFPQHKISETAKVALEQLGKSPDEIIDSFTQQQLKQDSLENLAKGQ